MLFCLPGLPPPGSLISKSALPTAVWLPREGKRHPPPEFYAQEVSLTLWFKSSLKEAPEKQTNKQTKPTLVGFILTFPRWEELR